MKPLRLLGHVGSNQWGQLLQHLDSTLVKMIVWCKFAWCKAWGPLLHGRWLEVGAGLCRHWLVLFSERYVEMVRNKGVKYSQQIAFLWLFIFFFLHLSCCQFEFSPHPYVKIRRDKRVTVIHTVFWKMCRIIPRVVRLMQVLVCVSLALLFFFLYLTYDLSRCQAVSCSWPSVEALSGGGRPLV